jgi:hypothetical protein
MWHHFTSKRYPVSWNGYICVVCGQKPTVPWHEPCHPHVEEIHWMRTVIASSIDLQICFFFPVLCRVPDADQSFWSVNWLHIFSNKLVCSVQTWMAYGNLYYGWVELSKVPAYGNTYCEPVSPWWYWNEIIVCRQGNTPIILTSNEAPASPTDYAVLFTTRQEGNMWRLQQMQTFCNVRAYEVLAKSEECLFYHSRDANTG